MSKSKTYDVSVFDTTSFGQAMADYVDNDNFADDTVVDLVAFADLASKGHILTDHVDHDNYVDYVDYDDYIDDNDNTF
jgi:hypothetical protein